MVVSAGRGQPALDWMDEKPAAAAAAAGFVVV